MCYDGVAARGGLFSTLSSRADILSFRWSCSLSLDSDRSLSTVSDRRLLCSSFIFSRCRAYTCRKEMGKGNSEKVSVFNKDNMTGNRPTFWFSTSTRPFLTLISSWFFSSSWASICLSLSSTLPWRSSAWRGSRAKVKPNCSALVHQHRLLPQHTAHTPPSTLSSLSTVSM